jgi:hypothetical protein
MLSRHKAGPIPTTVHKHKVPLNTNNNGSFRGWLNEEFFFFFVGLEFEHRTLSFRSRYSTAWVPPPVHFPLLILEMQSPELFAWSWSQTLILPISVSQVTRTTGMSHWCLASVIIFSNQVSKIWSSKNIFHSGNISHILLLFLLKFWRCNALTVLKIKTT